MVPLTIQEFGEVPVQDLRTTGKAGTPIAYFLEYVPHHYNFQIKYCQMCVLYLTTEFVTLFWI